MGPRKREGGVTSSPPSGSVGRCLDGAPEPSPGALCSFPNCQGECKSAGSAVRPVAHPEPPADRERFIDEYAHHIADQMGNPEVDCTVCGNDDHLKLIEAGAYHHRPEPIDDLPDVDPEVGHPEVYRYHAPDNDHPRRTSLVGFLSSPVRALP